MEWAQARGDGGRRCERGRTAAGSGRGVGTISANLFSFCAISHVHHPDGKPIKTKALYSEALSAITVPPKSRLVQGKLSPGAPETGAYPPNKIPCVLLLGRLHSLVATISGSLAVNLEFWRHRFTTR